MVRDGKIPSDRLTLADLPSAVEGWSHRAIVFAHTFDGYAHVGGGSPGPLWERLVGPAFEAFAHSRQIPELSLDDLRAIIFYLARADRQGGGYSLEGVQLSLYLAALDRIRSLLSARAHHGRMDHLEADYRRIAREHRGAILKMTARSSLPASVTRVFRATTKDALVSVLAELPVSPRSLWACSHLRPPRGRQRRLLGQQRPEQEVLLASRQPRPDGARAYRA